MQIILSEQEKEWIEQTRRGERNTNVFLSPDQEKCSLELTIHDPYKCAFFLEYLFFEMKKFTKEECGFEISAVSSIGAYSDTKDLKEDIINAIAKVLREHNLE